MNGSARGAPGVASVAPYRGVLRYATATGLITRVAVATFCYATLQLLQALSGFYRTKTQGPLKALVRFAPTRISLLERPPHPRTSVDSRNPRLPLIGQTSSLCNRWYDWRLSCIFNEKWHSLGVQYQSGKTMGIFGAWRNVLPGE
jgi:hypothetical protein